MSFWKPSPLFGKRLKRFRRLRRGWWSFLLLTALYLVTLIAEITCNSAPLALHHNGHWFFPVFHRYPARAFTADGGDAAPDYAVLNARRAFDGDFVLWPLFRNDPYRIVSREEILPYLRERVRVTPEPRVASLTLNPELVITRGTGIESLLEPNAPAPEFQGRPLSELWHLPEELPKSLESRWSGEKCPALEFLLAPKQGTGLPTVRLSFAAAEERPTGRKTLRARALEAETAAGGALSPRQWEFFPNEERPLRKAEEFLALPEELRRAVQSGREAIREQAQETGLALEPWSQELTLERRIRLQVEQEPLRFPFRPVPGHIMGLDSAGRDVFARIFYGLRIALNFGMLLVIFSLVFGTLAGILQGYCGGLVDLAGQRLTELWSALPFLYVMILMGSLYGAGFSLLLFCYAIFNWIGISHYMRAESLRLRKQPFVEAAKCLGIPGWRIALQHILPNALTPLITLFPFSLVGAIGSLAALDYLGFGLPAPTPSLGELLSQAQAERSAWWLTLYPSLALFIVMLLGVFIGEGIRNAFDPRQQQRLQ
jgi:microcin C transport system permease protein